MRRRDRRVAAGSRGLGAWRQDCGDVPRQELLDAITRVRRDALKDVTQVGFRIEIIQLRRFNESVKPRRTLPTGIRAKEQHILATEPWTAQCTLCGQIVDLEAPIIAVATQRFPPLQRVQQGEALSSLAGGLAQ